MNGGIGPRPRLLDSFRPLRLCPLDGEDGLPDPLGSVPLAIIPPPRGSLPLDAFLCIHMPPPTSPDDILDQHNAITFLDGHEHIHICA